MTNAVTFHNVEERSITQDVDQIVGGNASIFNMKVHQSKQNFLDSKSHDVTFNITFAMSIPGVYNKTNESFSTRNSFMDPMCQNNQYFHLEFDLFDKEIRKEPHKTDVGFYGSFAKIYPDKSESKVIPTWSDGEDTWVCWIQKFTFRITTQHIKCLCTHKMKVTIWDSKDKCAPKVRFDHPKPPKSASRSKSTNEIISWTKQLVLMISHNFSNTASYLENADRILPHQIMSSGILRKVRELSVPRIKSAKSNTTSKSSAPSPDSVIKEKESLLIYAEPKEVIDTSLGSYTQIEKLLETKSLNKTNDEINSVKSTKKKMDYSSSSVAEVSNTIRSESRKSTLLPVESDKYAKNGRISFDLSMPELFLSDQTVSRTPFPVNNIEDMFCMITIESNLLSSEQKAELNPLVINIRKIKNLPNKSKDFSELNALYSPIYCEYKFCDIEPHQTIGRRHSRNVKFDDVNVILLGLLDEIKLKNQLLNSFLTIKLFDRIENKEKERLNRCDDVNLSLNDVNIGDINITSSTPTVTSIILNRNRGEAKIDLSDIIKKRLKYLEVMVPIVPTSTNNINYETEPRKKCRDDNFGSYLEAETTIKVSFKLFESLTLSSEKSNEKFFNKIVIVNTDLSCDFIRNEVTMMILKYNCKKLNFYNDNITEMQTFLYGSNKSNINCDNLFTGVFIIDSKCEVLIIESAQENINMLYNTSTEILDKYQKRHYSNLNFLFNEFLVTKENENFQILSMVPLILSKDISFFVSQPLLYVRDMLPQECVEGICRIKELLETDSMHIVLRNNLIPTSHMLDSISQYLCSHIIKELIENDSQKSKIIAIKNEKPINRKEAKEKSLMERKNNNSPIKRPKTHLSVEYVNAKDECEFSYSCQSKNSISSAKEVIRSKFNPKRRYTYSQNYLFSGSFDTVDLDEEYAKEERMIKSEPKWINKGYQSIIIDFKNINPLPESRIDDLRKQWIENTLHQSLLKPTLPERDSKFFNFDLYIRPLKILNRDENSIMPSYFEQSLYNKTKKSLDDDVWRKKLCVSDINFKCHRVLPETEMIEKGRKSANQIAKLQGLKKDEQISKTKLDLERIPATYVLPISQEIYHSFTVGPDNYRNLLVNHSAVIEHDKDFKTVYQRSSESFIYKNSKKQMGNQILSPFTAYS